MFILNEDSKEVTNKRVYIPKNAQKVFQAMAQIYEPYLDTAEGGKVMKSYASQKAYNLKGNKNSFANGKETTPSISVDVAKMRLSRQNELNKNSIEYELYGGDLAHNILKKGVETARAVKANDKVKPPKPTSNSVKPKKVEPVTIDKPTGTVVVKESYDYEDEDMHPMLRYLEDYGMDSVLYEFFVEKTPRINWKPLIQPSMYVKALREFTQYGKFINFPTKWIYNWMGIIMRNTARLKATTELVGHGDSFDIDSIVYALSSYSWLKDHDLEVDYDDSYDFVKYTLTLQEALNKCYDEYGIEPEDFLNEETGVHSNGQYDLFMNQDEVNDYDREKQILDQIKEIRKYQPLFDYYNEQKSGREYIKIEKNGRIVRGLSVFELIGEFGIDEWLEMPDGSSAWSDYGLTPLFDVIEEYNSNSTPEETIVIINKALDVTHVRGDLASMFIEGGRQTLSQISEEINKPSHKVMISEKQIKILHQWLSNTQEQF